MNDQGLSAHNRVTVVAELSTNHFGDPERLEEMVRACSDAGADYVALQSQDVISTTVAVVSNVSKDAGIGWIPNVAGSLTHDLLGDYNPDVIAFDSPTISNRWPALVEIGRSFEGSVIVPSLMRSATYTQFMLDAFARANTVCLMQNNAASPTPAKQCNVKAVLDHREFSHADSRVIRGYASRDHGWLASGLAVAAGARLVMKRVKMETHPMPQLALHAVSLRNGDFTTYVDHIRSFETLRGSEDKAPTPSEHHKYAVNPRGA